ncbi:2'-5' RNA ligase family protein [Aeromicrobium wangtongii]|uniref:2'-5' RNA ligase family protein n=1 Tax=Aeromicrobium wangtongii TaxID=2969247 RepID=A0ABY5M4F3_9ACTN|nr:2'-5' RNA ligase family protein [Aeromicrobium wangtongii]MCD9198907.1 2'-5' RNA ligase family protein [Aeromicrobium wangtongii]UUP13055.1 2'-5' RNA ligase family protein [Aeromicrobium wangtongii]
MTTIGVAIPVPDPYGTQLREKRAEFGDPMAETVPSHVTLIPPTEVEDDQLEAVCAALDRASATLPPFPMRLRGTGTFRPVSPVVFVAVSQGISYTEMLARCVRTAIGGAEPEFPFHPHVTVAHNLDDASLDRAYEDLRDFECQFTVTEFALYHHEQESGWVPQRAFPLGQ